MNIYSVRVKHPDGEIQVVDLSHSQFVELMSGAPKKLPKEFYNAKQSVENGKGQNIKLLKSII